MVFTGGGIQEEVAVQISGDGTGLMSTLNQAEAGLMSLSGAATAVGGALVGLAGVMGGKAVNAAREFEQQMVELEKVTDPEIAREMGDSIQNMAERIPLAQKELADIAAQAGRLGVEGVDNIEEFTEVTSKMAVATDLTASDAANAFARITQLTGVPIDNVEELGSAINELSNTMATSSSEITDSVLRSGAAMSQLGLSAEQILGLSATLNEVSESSERAGTRLRRVAQELMNPRKVEDLAGALGMTAEEFTAMREDSPLQLIRQMVAAFESGSEQADALRQSLSTASRQAIGGLAQNSDQLTTALEASSGEFEKATSLTEEFAAANDTFNAQLTRTQNKLRNLAIETGERLLPALTRLLTHVNRGLDAFAELNDETDGMAGTLSILGIAVTGIVVLLSSLASLVGGPVIAAVVGAGAAVAGLAAAWKSNFANIQDITGRVARELQELFGANAPAWIKLFQDALGGLRSFWDDWGDEIVTGIQFVADTVGTALVQLVDIVVSSITLLMQLLTGDFAGALETFEGLFRRVWGRVLDFIDRWTDGFASKLVRGIVDAINTAGDTLEGWLNSLPGVDGVELGTVDVPESARRPRTGSRTGGLRRGDNASGTEEIRVTGRLEEEDGQLVAKIDERVERKDRRDSGRVTRRTGEPLRGRGI